MSSTWLRPVGLYDVGLPLSVNGMLIHTPKTKNNAGEFTGRFPCDYTRVEPCFRLHSNVPQRRFSSQIMERGMGEQERYKEAPFEPPVTAEVGELSLHGIIRQHHQQVNPDSNKK